MKRFLIFILFIPTLGFGQEINTTTKSGPENIYNNAIKQFITFSSRIDKIEYDTIFILKGDLPMDSLNTTIQKTKVVLLDSSIISTELQKQKSFVAYKIFPLDFDDGGFSINIVPFVVHKDNNEIIFDNSGTYSVSYTYDCRVKDFKFYKSTFYGF